MSRRTASTLVLAALAIAGTACNSARTLEEPKGGASCTACHGGAQSSTGAPPRDTLGRGDTSLLSVGAHGSHIGATHGIAAPVACESCHVVPSSFPQGTHGDGSASVSFGVFARQGAVAPAWDREAATCSVYCHGASLTGGSVIAPVWTRVDGTQVSCGSCHGAPPPQPHPQRADCGACHPATVQGTGGIVPGGAHLDGDVDVDYAAMGCTDCHGDATRSATALLRAAPPAGTHGETAPSTRAVGAHQAHLGRALFARPIACDECHVVPATPAHPDDRVQVVFGALATPDGGASPAWDRDTLRCSGTYCHGVTLPGGTNPAPAWTGLGQAVCGSCHGIPPPAPHTSGDRCHTCHPGTVLESGMIDVAGGAHVNGALEVERYHPTGWDAPTAHGYAANANLAGCKTCHGTALTGGDIGISCDTCHAAVVADWRTTCTFCHGDAQRADAIEAAPPVGTQGELPASDRAVGAHQSHLVAGDVSQGIACGECHLVPADVLQPQHVDGTVELTFGPLATARGAAASFDPTALTCAVYCHGATLAGGGVGQPLWTQVDGSQAACGACHGTPPPAPHPSLTACRTCHADTVLSDEPEHVIDVAGGRHVNGVADRTDYHPAGWASRTAHGYAANRDFASCQTCHGADHAGGSVGVSCNACHATNGFASWKTDCTFCHGNRASGTPAPPVGTEGEALPAERAVGAHAAHLFGAALGRPIACTECHPVPTDLSHLNGAVALAFGPLATSRSAVATFEPGTLGCANYCHGVNLPGAANPAPVWTAPGQATCGACHGVPPTSPHPAVSGAAPGSCRGCHRDTIAADGSFLPAGGHVNGAADAQAHDAAWTDPTSPGFHAYEADEGLTACQTCHGVNLDGPTPASACSACHGPGRPAPDLDGCTGCHGGSDNTTGAPPRARWGSVFGADPIRTGAHTAHVETTVAPQIGCAVCHVTPADAFTIGHVDPSPAEVVFGGLAANGTTPAAWDRAAPSCGTVYCHGATLAADGSNTAPLWTGGPGEATCGSCHGLPPSVASGHPAVTGGLSACSVCHPGTVDEAGAILPPASGGLHLDGVAQAAGGHEPPWSDPAGAGFHAYSANQGLSSCQLCHGPNLDGIGGTTPVACADCHGAGAPVLTCTGCHGGVDNPTGAPPRPQWAARSVPAEVALRSGAHSTHVTASAIAPPLDCDVCHPKPASIFTPGHVDASATADVEFGGLAAIGLTPAPTWDRTAGTCAVYCHGATLGGGSIAAPDWTAVGQGQADCGTCHGLPPPDPHPAMPPGVGCNDCHPKTVDPGGAVIPPTSGGTHLNGQLDGGHLPSWSDPASAGFHAYSANRGLASCRICHGQDLDGVGGTSTVACADCHTGVVAPELGCTGCHGGTSDQTGAPPKATWGNRTDTVRIGAHASHVGTNPVSGPIACGECHATPATMFTAGHIDPARAEVAFQGPVSGLAPGVWNYPTTAQPTCSSTYCHGNFVRGTASNAPDWTGTNQAACGSCHPARPAAFLHNRHQRDYNAGTIPWWPLPGGSTWVTCDQCHSGIAGSVNSTTPPALTLVNGSGPALHVNGTTDVVFEAGGTYVKGLSEGTCSSLACHPGETKAWPR